MKLALICIGMFLAFFVIVFFLLSFTERIFGDDDTNDKRR